MKSKIGTAICSDCGYTACDVGLDKNGFPYLVCWGECDGEQYFTKGKAPKLRRLLESYAPLPGKPTADELRAQFKLIDKGPAPAPAPAAAPAAAPVVPAAAPAPAKQKKFTTLLDKTAAQ